MEDGLVVLVHAPGNLAMFLRPQVGEATVHVVVQADDLVDLLHGSLPFLGEQARIEGAVVLGRYVGVRLPAPVGAGAVASVMADIKRLIPLGRRRLRAGDILVGVHVHSGAEDVLLNVGHQGLTGCLCGQGQRQQQQKKGVQSFHNRFILGFWV